MKLAMRSFTKSAATVVCAMSAFASPSFALDLYCRWPNNPCCDTRVYVDEQGARVTFEFGGRRYGPYAASVTQYRIQWNTNNGTPTQWTIDRMSGVLLQFERIGNVSYDPMPCVSDADAKPKF